ncbi:C80 family cysteine peptidase [Arsenophonus endosymbiont of Crataerina pallida]
MPKPKKYHFNPGFSQQKYIFDASKERFEHIANKFISYNDPSVAKEITGICLALTAAYLTQVREGGLEQGEKYIKGIQSLVKIIDSEAEINDPPYIKARHKARQLHAKQKMNLLFIDLIGRQRLSFDLYEMVNYQPSYSMWPQIQQNENIQDYFTQIIKFEANQNNEFVERFWFKELMIEIQRRINIHDNDLMNFKLIVQRTYLDLKKKYLTAYVDYYNDRGIKINKKYEKAIANDIKFEEFIKNFIDKDDINSNNYFELSSENHMMAIVIEKNNDTGLLKYAFFDPNYGIIYFDSREEFKQFLTYVIKERQDIYSFLTYDDNTYITSIIKLENNDVINKTNIFPTIERDLVNITTTKILCEEQSIFYLTNNIKLLFKEFNAPVGMTTIALIDENESSKIINLTINSIDSDIILETITELYKNFLALDNNNLYLNIDNDKCIVSRINYAGDSEAIAEFLLENFLNDTLQIHKNESLNDDIAVILDAWWDPKVNPEKIPSHSDIEIERLADTNYRHNLIIQFEGDEIVSKSVAKLISKHPDMTTVIQYDLELDRYRVAYGDINKVSGERARWFLIAHGRIDSATKKRTFARKTAQHIVTKLKYLKQTEFKNSDPEKIALLGGKLGEARIEDNFALDISQQLWHEGFNSIITAYTQDLHICHNGRKIVYLNEYESSRKDARYYKTIFNKEISPVGIQINHEILINYILREINFGNISLDSDFIKNSDYVKQYFYLPNGKLDINLLKLVALDNRAYNLFVDYIYETRAIYGNFNVNGLLEKLYEEKIFDTPLWKTVNNEAIQNNSYLVDKNNINKIIFRFTDEKKHRQQAELLASENPENTFIFQVDKNSNTIILEYGKLDNLQTTSIDKWILLGDVQLQDTVFLFEGMTTEDLVDVMNDIHKQHLLAIPGEISFFNKKALGRLSNPYDTSAIACQLAIKLAQKNITTNITTYQANIDPFPLPSLDGVAEYFDLIKNNKFSKFRYDQATEQLFYNDFNISHALFMDIAKGNIDPDLDFASYPYYLNQYLLDQDGNLITNRIKTIIYDPIISRKVNNYFLRNINQLPNALEQWQRIFSIDNNEALNIKIRNIDLLLENISYRPEIIYYLSDYSKNLLTELYSRSDGALDVASLMILINEPPQLNKLHMSLTELAGIDERSGLSELPLQESLFRSQQWHQYYLNNIISLTKKGNQDPNLTIKPLSHAFYFEKNVNLAKYIGLFYALTSNNTSDINRIWQYHRDLIEVSTRRKLLTNEQKFLNNFNEVVDWIVYFADSESLLYDQQNLILSESLANDPIVKYQLSINHIVFTILIEDKGYGYYQCKIFDPGMGEIKINQIAKENLDIKIISYIRNYLNSDVVIDNNSYKRYQLMGLEKDPSENYQFKLQKISDNLIIKTRGKDLIDKIPINENIFEANVNVKIGEYNISLLTLQQAGAHIEDIPISSFAIRNIANWQTKIRFDAEKLNDYLTLFSGTRENINIIKLIKEKIKLLPDHKSFLLENGNLNDYSVAMERLTDINNYVEPHLINRKLWKNLQLNMAQLPRYAHILNKISNITQLTSLIQLVSSTQSSLNYLNNPDISVNERQQIEKSLVIAWSAGIVNWGNEILQPLLVKAAYHITGARYSANLFAARLSIGINIAASGFDLYYAYENFNQLNYETDPVIRQDLIVNGTLSLLGAGVSITSALTMLAGSSYAGPVSIAIGTGLMVVGMFYNAYSTVERIKKMCN